MVASEAFRAAVDIGGTFTDVAVATTAGGLAVLKRLSTPPDYSRAVIEGISWALRELGVDPASPAEVIHATTIATNAIIQHAGARAALITTEGFRDVLEIGRLRIPRLYDIFYDKPPVLVPRRHVFEVRERIDNRGGILTPLDGASVEAAVRGVIDAGVDSVAICLINSYANPVHERAVAEALKHRSPEIDVSVSADILPQIGEYERTCTTVLDAYVKPVARRYLATLQERLEGMRIAGPLFIMQSGGGLTTVERAADRPVSLIESGPAAGVLAAGSLVSDAGLRNLLTFDMGGTSAKASIIEDGAVLKTTEYEVGGAISATTRLTGGGGYPISIPVIDVAEVGAGGGSIAWIDGGGGLRVGPRSAGALPGPACYGLGGTDATVTDANVVLGYLNPDSIAGDAVGIDPEAARRALENRIAGPLGLDPMNAAHGIHLIANSEMMGAIRAVSTQRGRDVRDFALVAFGGSGPVHAVELARAAGIGTVIVPGSPGLFSALGLLATDLEFQLSRMFYADLATLEPARLDGALGELRDGVVEMAARGAGNGGALDFEIEADMHYWGQSHPLTVGLPFGKMSRAALEDLAERFEVEHERTYGHRAEGEAVILVGVRLTGRCAPTLALSGAVRAAAGGRANGGTHRRPAYFGAAAGIVDTPVIGRPDLAEAPRPGPLLIEEYDSVTVVPPGCGASRDGAGNIVVAVAPAAPGGTRGVSPRQRYAGDAPAAPGGTRGVSPRQRYAGDAPAAPGD